MAETFSTFTLKPGDPAPDFTLPAPDGTPFSRDNARGPSGILVVFACNHCPFVVMLADALGRVADEFRDRGIGVVAISANDVENYPQDAPEKMTEFAADHGWNFPYLHDASQAVAKAYGAACTPDFFLFDADARLYYAGQFDDARPSGDLEPDGRDLRAAADHMLAGEPLPAPARPSSGCNIKWKPGNEPAYFG